MLQKIACALGSAVAKRGAQAASDESGRADASFHPRFRLARDVTGVTGRILVRATRSMLK
jgi:hypothetical protein